MEARAAVQGKLPGAAVWATNGNYSFKKRLATEEKGGFVNMGIGVTANNVTTELFIFRQDIAPISESADTGNITADETAVKKAIDECRTQCRKTRLNGRVDSI